MMGLEMLRVAILSAVLIGSSSWAAAVAAEPAVLVCDGTMSPTSPTMVDELGGVAVKYPKDVVLQVVVDFDKRTVFLNGREMVVRSITEDELVFSTRKAGFVAAWSAAPVFTIDRRTGVMRSGSITARCEQGADKPNLF